MGNHHNGGQALLSISHARALFEEVVRMHRPESQAMVDRSGGLSLDTAKKAPTPWPGVGAD